MTIGEKLRRLRNRDRYSYADLATRAGCSEGALRKIEGGSIRQPNVDLSLKLCRILKAPLEWLADDAQDWPPPPSENDQIIDVVRRALSAGGLGEWDPAERVVLEHLRRLRQEHRAVIIGYVVTMIGQYVNAAQFARLEREIADALSSPAEAGRGPMPSAADATVGHDEALAALRRAKARRPRRPGSRDRQAG